MGRYFLRRLLQAVVVLWLLTVIVFAIARLSGNPVDLLLPQGAPPSQRAALRTSSWHTEQRPGSAARTTRTRAMPTLASGTHTALDRARRPLQGNEQPWRSRSRAQER